MCVFTMKVTLGHTQAGAEKQKNFFAPQVTRRTHGCGRAVALHADGTVSLGMPVWVCLLLIFFLNKQTTSTQARPHRGHLTAKS